MNIHGHAQAEDRLQTNSTKLRAAIGLLCSLLLLFFGLGLVLSGCVSTGVIFLALLLVHMHSSRGACGADVISIFKWHLPAFGGESELVEGVGKVIILKNEIMLMLMLRTRLVLPGVDKRRS